MARHKDLDRFYGLLDRLEGHVDGARKLKNATGRMDWPARGVYFFFEPGETREKSDRLRVTRVGTHGVAEGSSTSLWDRLKQHYGTGSGSENHPHGGSHRSSVYRLRVGQAITEKYDLNDDYPDWDQPWSSIDRERSQVRDEEFVLERRVSAYIREQPFLWVALDDEPGPDSDRAFLERNAIALLSNFDTQTVDPRPDCWLGRYSPSPEIRESGLWNVNHVDEDYDRPFLDLLETAIRDTNPP